MKKVTPCKFCKMKIYFKPNSRDNMIAFNEYDNLPHKEVCIMRKKEFKPNKVTYAESQKCHKLTEFFGAVE